jgi:UDP:flavonoid glycosyltransferase YjiC (YdhE family)
VGSAGDVHPFIGVGKALRARGHDVVLLGNEVFADVMERAGLEFVQSGDAETFTRTNEDPDIYDPGKSLGVVIGGMVIPELRDTIASIEARLDGTDVLVGSTLGFAARVVRELHDVPLVIAHLAPNSFRSNHRLPKSDRMLVSDRSPRWMKRSWWAFVDAYADRAVGPELNAVRAERGLGPVSRILSQWIHSPDRTLGLFPDWFGPPQPDWPKSVRLTGFPLYDEGDQRPVDTDLEAWLDDDAPPVVFTAGSANVRGEAFFSAALSVCGALDLRAVLVTRNPDIVPPNLPPTVRHEAYVPFGRLLPRSRALVSHGGVGTCAQALAAGIPHLIAHMAFDQRDNGSRLEDLGAGRAIPMGKFHGRRAQKALGSVLGEDAVTRARELSELVDRDAALDRTCQEIEAVGIR